MAHHTVYSRCISCETAATSVRPAHVRNVVPERCVRTGRCYIPALRAQQREQLRALVRKKTIVRPPAKAFEHSDRSIASLLAAAAGPCTARTHEPMLAREFEQHFR